MSLYQKVYPSSQKFRITDRVSNFQGSVLEFQNQATVILGFDLQGEKLPDWRLRCRTGRPATTSLSVNVTNCSHSETTIGSQYWEAPPNVRTASDWRERTSLGDMAVGIRLNNPGSPAGLDLSNAQQAALGKFYQKLKDSRQALQGGALLGEIGETFRMVKSNSLGIMSRLTSWNRALQRAKRYTRTRQHRLKEASDRWLEFQFGVNPLIQDINAGLESFVEPRKEVRRVRGNGKDNFTTSSSTAEIPFGALYTHWTDKVTTVREFRYLGAVAAEVPGAGTVMARLGLLPSDFIPTLYELLPWSFLVDYFSNLGSVIGSICEPTSNVVWAQQGSKASFMCESTMSARVNPDFKWVVWTSTSPYRQTYETTRITRSGLTFSEIPSLELKLKVPGFSKKWLNLSALVAARSFKYWP